MARALLLIDGFVIVGLAIVDKVGRRRLTLVMVPGAAISLFVLGAFFVTDNAGRDNIGFIIACLIVGAAIGYAMSGGRAVAEACA